MSPLAEPAGPQDVKVAAATIDPMLRNLTRFLVALAVALAVPAQGYAAVAAGLCMALGHHQDAQAGSNDRGTHDHGAASASDHGAAAAHDPGTDGDKPEKSHDKAHCPPCVSCCAAATIAPAAGTGVPEIAPVAAVASSPYSLAGILPEKLDRPPLAL